MHKLAVVLAVGSLAVSSPADAELVVFSTGRTMSIQSHRVEGTTIVLVPRAGGEIRCQASIVARFEADEVPYPEPEMENVRLEPSATETGQGSVRVSTSSGRSELLEERLQADHPEYDRIIQQASVDQGVDARLVHAVIQVESRYERRARSPKGAMGLMQLMPATARRYALTDPYDPAANVRAGVRHLKSLLERFPLVQALAAYNAGEAAVQRFRGVPPYPETQSYVRRVLALASR